MNSPRTGSPSVATERYSTLYSPVLGPVGDRELRRVGRRVGAHDPGAIGLVVPLVDLGISWVGPCVQSRLTRTPVGVVTAKYALEVGFSVK